MFSKKEVVFSIVDLIKEKYFIENKDNKYIFKDNAYEILLNTEESVSRDLKTDIIEGIYSYGNPSDILSYFIFIDKNNEGFIWIRSFYKENRSYNFSKFLFATENYKKVSLFYEKINPANLAKPFTKFKRDNDKNNIKFNSELIFSCLVFKGFLKTTSVSHDIHNPTRIKILGLLAINSLIETDNPYDIKLSKYVKECLINFGYNNNHFENNINYLTAKEIQFNIDYILKYNISLKSIFKAIEYNLKTGDF